MRTEHQVFPNAVDDIVEPTAVLPVAGRVSDGNGPIDVLDLFALSAFTAGRQPYARTVRLTNVRLDAPLLPAGATILREAVDNGDHSHLAADDGWTLRATKWKSSRTAVVTVTAVTAELADRIFAATVDGAVEEAPPAADRVRMGFWHLAAHGPRRTNKSITADEWDSLRGNYSARAGAALDRLMKVTPETVNGRLLLLYGPPGTGKTTLLRGLAREWRDWCQVDCVLDPERLFADPGYLLTAALSTEDNEDNAEPRWRMLILEDCDELIRGEAKATTGQALARLLNLTDGLLGQGRNVLVAITTNEDLSTLHPAVTRPGRCLARIEVDALPADEAAAWLGTRTGVPTSGATLAELYALRAGVPQVSTPEPDRNVGLYL